MCDTFADPLPPFRVSRIIWMIPTRQLYGGWLLNILWFQVIKDASLTESQKTAKTNEYQTLLKEMTNAQFIMQMGNPMAESDEGAHQVNK